LFNLDGVSSSKVELSIVNGNTSEHYRPSPPYTNNEDIKQYARYILNHYDRNSEKDVIVLAKDLEKRFKEEYDKGFDCAQYVDYYPNA
jgi:hypothetical protein